MSPSLLNNLQVPKGEQIGKLIKLWKIQRDSTATASPGYFQVVASLGGTRFNVQHTPQCLNRSQ